MATSRLNRIARPQEDESMTSSLASSLSSCQSATSSNRTSRSNSTKSTSESKDCVTTNICNVGRLSGTCDSSKNEIKQHLCPIKARSPRVHDTSSQRDSKENTKPHSRTSISSALITSRTYRSPLVRARKIAADPSDEIKSKELESVCKSITTTRGCHLTGKNQQIIAHKTTLASSIIISSSNRKLSTSVGGKLTTSGNHVSSGNCLKSSTDTSKSEIPSRRRVLAPIALKSQTKLFEATPATTNSRLRHAALYARRNHISHNHKTSPLVARQATLERTEELDTSLQSQRVSHAARVRILPIKIATEAALSPKISPLKIGGPSRRSSETPLGTSTKSFGISAGVRNSTVASTRNFVQSSCSKLRDDEPHEAQLRHRARVKTAVTAAAATTSTSTTTTTTTTTTNSSSGNLKSSSSSSSLVASAVVKRARQSISSRTSSTSAARESPVGDLRSCATIRSRDSAPFVSRPLIRRSSTTSSSEDSSSVQIPSQTRLGTSRKGHKKVLITQSSCNDTPATMPASIKLQHQYHQLHVLRRPSRGDQSKICSSSLKYQLVGNHNLRSISNSNQQIPLAKLRGTSRDERISNTAQSTADLEKSETVEIGPIICLPDARGDSRLQETLAISETVTPNNNLIASYIDDFNDSDKTLDPQSKAIESTEICHKTSNKLLTSNSEPTAPSDQIISMPTVPREPEQPLIDGSNHASELTEIARTINGNFTEVLINGTMVNDIVTDRLCTSTNNDESFIQSNLQRLEPPCCFADVVGSSSIVGSKKLNSSSQSIEMILDSVNQVHGLNVTMDQHSNSTGKTDPDATVTSPNGPLLLNDSLAISFLEDNNNSLIIDNANIENAAGKVLMNSSLKSVMNPQKTINEPMAPIAVPEIVASSTSKNPLSEHSISNIPSNNGACERVSNSPRKDEHEATLEPSVLGTLKPIDISINSEPILNYYDLEARPFARGKFAQVKRCIKKTTNQCFAAKCIKKRRRLVDVRHEILLEIEALKLSYSTDYIVKLFEVFETPNEMVLVLEMAKGGELQKVIDDEESIKESIVKRMIGQILEGLIYLHDNQIAHLDIKPQNILLTEPFPDGHVKLCDFGISRRITKDCEIREICGTPDYVAPEILSYDPISLATDMWSMGVLTYVLLTGYSPFGSENKQQTFLNITQAVLDFPAEMFSNVSNEAVDFMQKLIVRNPRRRLTSRQASNHSWLSQ